jgi:uncharacterized protein (TIGR01244 family)
MLRRIDEAMLVSGQIQPEDVPLIAATGVTLIINNRPDGEVSGQPLSTEIETAAREAGIDYCFIPVSGGLSPELVEAMADALAGAEGPVLAYCTSGTRSTYLWAMARAKAGDDPDEIVGKATAAGYDLAPLRQHLG